MATTPQRTTITPFHCPCLPIRLQVLFTITLLKIFRLHCLQVLKSLIFPTLSYKQTCLLFCKHRIVNRICKQSLKNFYFIINTKSNCMAEQLFFIKWCYYTFRQLLKFLFTYYSFPTSLYAISSKSM